ncbi:MAG: AAA family ATPase, partial [Candidatus Lokiarchaeota archaeon]
NFISLNATESLESQSRCMIDQIKFKFQQAKNLRPSIIFIDHIDAIAPKIEEVVGKKEHIICSQLLSLIDGIGSEDDILIIGATNKPELLEPALLRSGRLNHLIELKLPDEKARTEIFQIHLKSIPTEKNVSIENLAKTSKCFTGADISAVCREAKKLALKRTSPNLPEINSIDVNSELKAMKPLLDDILIIQDDFELAIKNISELKHKSKNLLKELN